MNKKSATAFINAINHREGGNHKNWHENVTWHKFMTDVF